MAFEEYKRKIEYFIKNIPQRMYIPISELIFEGFFTYERLGLKEAKERERMIFPIGLNWGKKWEYGWFFTEIIVPKEGEGKRIEFSARQGESVVFVNGKLCGAFDKEHTRITLTHSGRIGEKFEIAMEVYAGHDGLENTLDQEHVRYVIPERNVEPFPDYINQKTIKKSTVGIFYDEVFQFWMDIKTLYDLSGNLDENSLRKARIDKALQKMCDCVDIESPFDEFLDAVKRGREILNPILKCRNGDSAPTLYAIGHSHLDLEWLWTKEETRRKIARTIGNQLMLIREYKDYKYVQSQPWLLEILKCEYADLYQELKRAVKEGNIIIEGGMWVESDVNIPCGESLIRQFLFGKKFIKDEFGLESEILWLPDIFGVSPALPQIMKGCGIQYFMNAKIPWQYNGGDKIPHSNFMWQGIDGSMVLTNLTQDYATELTPSKVIEKWNMNQEKADVPIQLLPYGHGDGGGGATRIHLEYLKRENNLEGMPKVISKSPNLFFETLAHRCEINERYVGELYYTAHRGTYTAQAKTKKLNRQSEFALREVELWSAFFQYQTKEEVDEQWKTVLFHQFHDILPGTAIDEVYVQAEKAYNEVLAKTKVMTTNICREAVKEKQGYITVFNSLSWDRKVCITLPEGYTSIENGETQNVGTKTLAMVDVPACGFCSYQLGKKLLPVGKKGKEYVLENDLIRVEFNQNGEMICAYDKEKKMEYLAKPSNVFRMYQDMPTVFDAWDIDSFYEKTEIKLSEKAEMQIEYQGDIMSSLLISKKILNSSLRQRVILRKYSKKIEFETEIDWNETHKLLKVDFNTNINTEELISEIQYGYVKRPNHRTRPYDADRFEVCQHKWSALCEGKRGIAILNDSKYGVSAEQGKISLTLLTASVKPAFYADKGKQIFTYAFFPFSESLADSDVIREAYALHCPAIVQKGYCSANSFLRVSERNIIVDTVKMAEDGSGDIIVRLYECQNTYTSCILNFGISVKVVYKTDMLEQNLTQIAVKSGGMTLNFKSFEIITLRVKKN